jgi:hypothetical protein
MGIVQQTTSGPLGLGLQFVAAIFVYALAEKAFSAIAARWSPRRHDSSDGQS